MYSIKGFLKFYVGQLLLQDKTQVNCCGEKNEGRSK